jgi:hypothetical protein
LCIEKVEWLQALQVMRQSWFLQALLLAAAGLVSVSWHAHQYGVPVGGVAVSFASSLLPLLWSAFVCMASTPLRLEVQLNVGGAIIRLDSLGAEKVNKILEAVMRLRLRPGGYGTGRVTSTRLAAAQLAAACRSTLPTM